MGKHNSRTGFLKGWATGEKGGRHERRVPIHSPNEEHQLQENRDAVT